MRRNKPWRSGGESANQFDVVYKIINDFNYRGNGIFVVPGARERCGYKGAQYSNEAKKGPVFVKVRTHEVHLHATLGVWKCGFNFQWIPQSYELYNGISYYESQNFWLALSELA